MVKVGFKSSKAFFPYFESLRIHIIPSTPHPTFTFLLKLRDRVTGNMRTSLQNWFFYSSRYKTAQDRGFLKKVIIGKYIHTPHSNLLFPLFFSPFKVINC